MTSLFGPLKQAIDSASQFLSPRKRTREHVVNCSDDDDWNRSNYAGERGTKRVAVEGQVPIERCDKLSVRALELPLRVSGPVLILNRCQSYLRFWDGVF
mmetsp:Transcript_643/g.994  ORF Transcript_643/g.994 Transcript_643/m.994 type:complete len:99 (-) Transcript_643:897-1193(-)